MVQTFLKILVCFLILLPQQLISAELAKNNYLSQRQADWPLWDLPAPFKHSQLKEDLIYPDFFKGEWTVFSIDLIHSNPNPFIHMAKFKYDSLGRVIGDRAFNALSVGKKAFGTQLIDVIDDPSFPNRQLAIFKGGEYMETKIVGRRQEITQDDIYLFDEISLQIFHSPNSPPRINQIETLSKYQYCKKLRILMNNLDADSICGEQWQARYEAPGKNVRLKPINKNHFRLFLTSSKDQAAVKKLLIDLSNQIEGLVQDDL